MGSFCTYSSIKNCFNVSIYISFQKMAVRQLNVTVQNSRFLNRLCSARKFLMAARPTFTSLDIYLQFLIVLMRLFFSFTAMSVEPSSATIISYNNPSVSACRWRFSTRPLHTWLYTGISIDSWYFSLLLTFQFVRNR